MTTENKREPKNDEKDDTGFFAVDDFFAPDRFFRDQPAEKNEEEKGK